MIIGIIGGFVYIGASALMPKIKVDDPVEAFPVHGACGIWGVLAAAIFDWGNFMDGRVHGWHGGADVMFSHTAIYVGTRFDVDL